MTDQTRGPADIKAKKPYAKPELRAYGTIAELTATIKFGPEHDGAGGYGYGVDHGGGGGGGGGIS